MPARSCCTQFKQELNWPGHKNAKRVTWRNPNMVKSCQIMPNSSHSYSLPSSFLALEIFLRSFLQFSFVALYPSHSSFPFANTLNVPCKPMFPYCSRAAWASHKPCVGKWSPEVLENSWSLNGFAWHRSKIPSINPPGLQHSKAAMNHLRKERTDFRSNAILHIMSPFAQIPKYHEVSTSNMFQASMVFGTQNSFNG